MGLTSQQIRYPNSEYWSLEAEQEFLDHLGSHRNTGASKLGKPAVDPQRRRQLLKLYIKAALICKNRQPWKAEAVKYAQWLIEREVEI